MCRLFVGCLVSFDCMSEDELTLWRSSAYGSLDARVPCIDCPAWFEALAKAQGCCQRVGPGRPRLADDDPKRARLRQQWREASVRARQRRRAGAK